MERFVKIGSLVFFLIVVVFIFFKTCPETPAGLKTPEEIEEERKVVEEERKAVEKARQAFNAKEEQKNQADALSKPYRDCLKTLNVDEFLPGNLVMCKVETNTPDSVNMRKEAARVSEEIANEQRKKIEKYEHARKVLREQIQSK